MSWDAYVNNLLAGGVLEYAAIVGQDGNIWASNFGVAAFPTYNTPVPDPNNPDVTTDQEYNEQANFVKGLNNNGITGHPAGVRINNQKYYTVNYDGEAGTWFLKKEKGGAAVVKTKTGVVVGTFSTAINMENGAPQNAGEANKRVIDTAKYLSDNGI